MNQEIPRFDNEITDAIAASRQEALRLSHLFINTDDLLMGIISIGASKAGEVMQLNHVDIHDLQHELATDTIRSSQDSQAATILGLELTQDRNILLTDLTERIMRQGMQLAIEDGTRLFDTRHIIRAVLQDRDNPTAQRLMKRGLKSEAFA